MTCIVGLVNKRERRVYIGGDSAGCAGWGITIRKDPKVFKNGPFIIGCTSSFRMIELLQYSFVPPELPTGKKVPGDDQIYRYMCTKFVDEVRKTFKDGGFMEKHSDAEKGGLFIVGYKDRLFSIESDFQVGEPLCGMYAIGCGGEYALGALDQATNHNIPSATAVKRALESSEKFSAGVSKPFLILHT